MPIYEYRCENGHVFEVFRSMSDDPVTACEVCGAPVERVFHPVAVHFKGSGFYTTDYAKKGSGQVVERRRLEVGGRRLGLEELGLELEEDSDSSSKSDSQVRTSRRRRRQPRLRSISPIVERAASPKSRDARADETANVGR